MNKVFLINENTLKNETILNDNVGAEYIMPAIETSQDIYLHQLIGSELLEKLYNLINTNTINNDENAQYKTLIDEYITNYLKYKVLAEITIPLAYKYRSSGVMQSNTDHANNSQMKDAVLVQNHYELRANFYADRMSKFLNANSNSFPEYMSTRNNADLRANPDSYQTNILL
jgi:hypothetical protein